MNSSGTTLFSASGPPTEKRSTIKLSPSSRILSLARFVYDKIDRNGSERDVELYGEIPGEWVKAFRDLREEMRGLFP